MSKETAIRLRITGIVQGVGFRWSLSSEARHLGLRGWVRNRRDGSVEALIVGAGDEVAALIRWAHRGPPAAHVDAVEQQPVAASELLPGEFSEYPTL
ncbi:MAG: acylphosphatase [Betaproteobacteria bacterium]|nr:acylphosphatase [Betaproteobacteria bacterium]